MFDFLDFVEGALKAQTLEDKEEKEETSAAKDGVKQGPVKPYLATLADELILKIIGFCPTWENFFTDERHCNSAVHLGLTCSRFYHMFKHQFPKLNTWECLPHLDAIEVFLGPAYRRVQPKGTNNLGTFFANEKLFSNGEDIEDIAPTKRICLHRKITHALRAIGCDTEADLLTRSRGMGFSWYPEMLEFMRSSVFVRIEERALKSAGVHTGKEKLDALGKKTCRYGEGRRNRNRRKYRLAFPLSYFSTDI